MVLDMRIKKRFIQGVGQDGGEFEGYQILNDESDGTFYPIKDSKRNVAILCKKLNSLVIPDILTDRQKIKYYTVMDSNSIHVAGDGHTLLDKNDVVIELNRLYNLVIAYKMLFKSNEQQMTVKDVQNNALRKENEMLKQQLEDLQEILLSDD
jgi:hypothetical protein